MSFIANLAKGFVRSAVNQVGRDGGKVVSNSIYGNSHSTPINSTGNVSQDSIEGNIGLLKEKEYPIIKIVYAILLSGLIPIIGSLVVFYRAIINLKAKQMTMFKLENRGVYKSDRRFTNGQRYEGERAVKIPVKVDITEKEKKIKFFKGISYLIISFSAIIMYSTSYINGDLQQGTENQKESGLLNNNSFTDCIYKIPESEYEYSVKIESIETKIIKNAFSIKEDKYTVAIKKDGYKMVIKVAITNPYKKEMQNIPFPYNFCITSENKEFFCNNTTNQKIIGNVIFPKIKDAKNRQIELSYSKDYFKPVISLNFKPNETKTFLLEYENPILNEVKNLILIDLGLRNSVDDDIPYQVKGLIIDTQTKKIIGEQKY